MSPVDFIMASRLLLLIYGLPWNSSADVDAERRKKKKTRVVRDEAGLGLGSQPSFAFENTDRIKQIAGIAQPDGSYTSKENFNNDVKEVWMIYIYVILLCIYVLDNLFYLHMEVHIEVELRIIEIAVSFGGRLKMFSWKEASMERWMQLKRMMSQI
jgi:hypothetical protein